MYILSAYARGDRKALKWGEREWIKKGMQRITIRFMKPSTPHTAGISHLFSFASSFPTLLLLLAEKNINFRTKSQRLPYVGIEEAGFFFHDCRKARPPLTGGGEGTFLIGHLTYAGISLRIERSICQKRAWGEWEERGYFSLSRPRNTLSPPLKVDPQAFFVGSFKEDKSKYTAPPNYPISWRIWTNYLRQEAKWKEYLHKKN